MYYIQDIYFFEVNAKFISSHVLKTSAFSFVRIPKYISSNVLKTSVFSQVQSTSENADVFNTRDEIYLVFTGTSKSKFSLFFYISR